MIVVQKILAVTRTKKNNYIAELGELYSNAENHIGTIYDMISHRFRNGIPVVVKGGNFAYINEETYEEVAPPIYVP